MNYTILLNPPTKHPLRKLVGKGNVNIVKYISNSLYANYVIKSNDADISVEAYAIGLQKDVPVWHICIAAFKDRIRISKICHIYIFASFTTQWSSFDQKYNISNVIREFIIEKLDSDSESFFLDGFFSPVVIVDELAEFIRSQQETTNVFCDSAVKE